MARALVDTSSAPHRTGAETLEGWALVDVDLFNVEVIEINVLADGSTAPLCLLVLLTPASKQLLVLVPL